MNGYTKIAVGVLATFLVLPVFAQNSTPQSTKMQGYLTDRSGGTPQPADGTYTMQFDLYDADVGGLLIAGSGQLSVPVSNGLYEVDLPFAVADFGDSERYIEIIVDPDGAGTEPSETLAPRVKIVSAPFAYMAEELDGFDSTDFAVAVHGHAGGEITSGTVAEGVIDAALARDNEVFPIVLSSDGAGSGLDADLLDGTDSTAFMPAGADNWVNIGGDTMTGTLVLGSSANLDLGGELRKNGALFMHNRSTDGLAVGEGALQNATPGVSNTAIGKWAMRDNTSSGTLNTALGTNALRANTDGAGNVALGVNALLNNQHGGSNIAIGFEAGREAQGGGNIFIGTQAGLNAGDGIANIYLGTSGDPDEDFTIRIGYGPGGQNRAFIQGIRSRTTGEADAIPVLIDSNGQLGTVSSSREYKEEIRAIENVSNQTQALRPVTFRYKEPFADGDKPLQYGLIAEEVAEVFPDLVVYDAEGNPETVKYHVLSTILLAEVQSLHERIEELEARLAAGD